MIYVFGRFGYLGRNLIPYLEQRGYEVEGVGRLDAMPNFCADDCVINAACAGWMPWEEPDVNRMVESNAILPMAIAARLNGANMIHMGASVEWQRPDLTYSWTKRLATDALTRLGCAHICHVYTIFGGKDPAKFRFMDSFIEAVRTGRDYTLTEPLGTRDWMHVDRICEGIESLVTNRDHKIHHFGTGITRKFIDILDMARLITGDLLLNIQVANNRDGVIWGGADPPFFKDTLFEDLKREIMK
jgi:nucleoside-diphosphate-sugar epimerase